MPIIIPCLKDNYSFLIFWEEKALVIDPSEAAPILQALDKRALTHILITHHHSDHVAGNKELKKKTHAKILGSDQKIPGIDEVLPPPKTLFIGPFSIEILKTPGHTKTHIAYYFSKEKWLFSGDSLFAAGCGKVLDENYQEMFSSLQKLASLPDDTALYCGHEYTRQNLQFALSLSPSQPAVQKRLEMLSDRQISIPSTLEEEKRTNPFLRTQDPILRKALNLEDSSQLDVFIALRKKKDQFSTHI